MTLAENYDEMSTGRVVSGSQLTARSRILTSSGGDLIMLDRPGIAMDDLAWIHRDEFVHYIELAHGLSEPHDWPRLREGLLRALTAAFGLDAGNVHDTQFASPQRRALDVLDDIRRHHNPSTDWPAFFDALWSRRHAIRTDLT